MKTAYSEPGTVTEFVVCHLVWLWNHTGGAMPALQSFPDLTASAFPAQITRSLRPQVGFCFLWDPCWWNSRDLARHWWPF